MIEYFNRYSNTDLPDNMGRWARIGIYKNIRISWISRVETKDEIVFCASWLFFPEKDEDILKQVSSSDYFTNYYNYSENECKHPKEQRTFIGSNLLRCGVCGEEFS